MLARYLDAARDQVLEHAVAGVADIEPVLTAASRSSGQRGTPAVEFSRNDGSSLVVAQTPTGCVLLHTDSVGVQFHSVGDPDSDGIVVFDFFGSNTEVPAEVVVPGDAARKAVIEYFLSGSPLATAITWEPE